MPVGAAGCAKGHSQYLAGTPVSDNRKWRALSRDAMRVGSQNQLTRDRDEEADPRNAARRRPRGPSRIAGP